MSKQSIVTTRNDSAKPSWHQPQVRRIHAGQAEAATNTGTDNFVFS